jgi:hypothetical protein
MARSLTSRLDVHPDLDHLLDGAIMPLAAGGGDATLARIGLGAW